MTVRVSPSGSVSLASTAMSTGRFRPVDGFVVDRDRGAVATATVTVAVSVAIPSVTV